MKTRSFRSYLRSSFRPYRKIDGFSLVEMMITVALSGVIIAAIYASYSLQQKTGVAQDQVREMQQNLRAAMMLISRDLRMAGYDPTGNAGAGITAATSGRISFTKDSDDGGDGDLDDTNEQIDIGFSASDDSGADGIADNGAASLGKQSGGAGGYQPIAENIHAVEFAYLDSAGNTTATLADIRSVQVSILARAGQRDAQFVNGETYFTASGTTWGPFDDNYRRRLLATTLYCRNLGL